MLDPFFILAKLSNVTRSYFFGRQERVEFYREMYLMQRGGISKLESLRSIEDAYTRQWDWIDSLPERLQDYVSGLVPQPVLVRVAQEGIAGVRTGQTLDEALESWIPPAELALISAGEASGELVGAYTRAIKLVESQEGMWAAAIAGLAYPLLLGVMICMTLYSFATEMLPTIAATADVSRLVGAGAIVIAISEYIQNWWEITLFFGFLFLLLVLFSMPLYTGPGRVWLDRIPPWSIYRSVHGALFLSSFSTLQRSGMPIEKCLITLMKSGSPWLQSRIKATLYGVRQGYTLGESLVNSGYEFPDRSRLSMLVLFCKQARYAEVLEDFAEEWLRITAKMIKRLSSRFLIIGMVAMASVIGLLVLGLVDIQSSFAT
jgi:type II secretory pathway component PulF